MWIIYAVGVAVALFFMLAPGYILMRAFGQDRFASIGCSAPLSIGLYTLWATTLSAMGVSCAWPSVFLPIFVAAIVCYAIARVKRFDNRSNVACSRRDVDIFAGYIAVALLVTCYAFVVPMDGADSFVLSFDNAYHLNRLEVMADSGNWSTIGAGTDIYYDYGDGTLVSPNGVMDPTSLSGFYPSAWHIFTAMIVDAIGCPVTVAANASTTAFLIFAYPAGMFYLAQVLFPGNKWARMGIGVCSMAFVSFQWVFISSALVSNLAGMCLMPAAAALFIEATGCGKTASQRAMRLFAFFLCLVALALSQPNCLFSLMVLLVPYCLWSIYRQQRLKKRPVLKVACLLGFVLVVVLVWAVAYHAPFMQSIIYAAYRPAYASAAQAIVDILTLSFRWSNAQILLGFAVVAGGFLVSLGKAPRWLLASYVLMCGLFFVSATRNGFWDYLLTGFWYTDQQRLAAACALFAVPLAGLGFGEIARRIVRVVRRQRDGGAAVAPIAALAICAVFLACVLYPSFSVSGWGKVDTAFGRSNERLANMYAESGERNLYTGDEREFVEQVKDLVGSDDVVLNIPVDGSAFSFAQDHLNVYYRSHRLGGAEEAALIRDHLSELAENPSVQKAIASTGIKYVMLLDYDDGKGNQTVHHSYDADEWTGVNSITEETPGFKLVLSKGDMRLYKIDEKYWCSK